MSGIKALDKLRTAARNMAKGRNLENHEECNLLLIIADEIEAEIAEHYMLLPCDADGVPIRVGDRLLKSTGAPKKSYGEVVGVSEDSVWFAYENNGYDSNWANLTRHVIPHMLEDVLRDVWKEALDYAKSDMWRNPDEVFAERADEIRAMFGEVDR